VTTILDYLMQGLWTWVHLLWALFQTSMWTTLKLISISGWLLTEYGAVGLAWAIWAVVFWSGWELLNRE
jgi:hypothetical protein